MVHVIDATNRTQTNVTRYTGPHSWRRDIPHSITAGEGSKRELNEPANGLNETADIVYVTLKHIDVVRELCNSRYTYFRAKHLSRGEALPNSH